MKTAGIIVEYNPMHFGHLHHLEKTREETGADVIVAVMSGNVVQRGEFAIADKFTRTKWALEAGVDLVVELPAFLTLQNADLFAWAAVSLLDRLDVDTLVFGSETGDTEILKRQSELMRTDLYNDKVKGLMNEGHSYPTANQMVLEKLSGRTFKQAPNDILGVQYLNAIHTLESRIEPVAIKRVGSDYYGSFNDTRKIQSATAIRTRLLNGETVDKSMPDHVIDSLKGIQLNALNQYDGIIRYLLAIHNRKTLGNTFSFEEGLESWMLKHRDAPSHQALVKAMATRRYTQARIKRSIMHMMLGTTKQDAPDFALPYIRILGMTRNGQAYLNKIKSRLNVELITKIGRERPPLLDLELRTSRLYGISAGPNIHEQEFDPVIIL